MINDKYKTIVRILKKNRDKYNTLKNELIFERFENADLFILTMIYGFIKGSNRPLKENDKSMELFEFARESAMTSEDISILYSVVISHFDFDDSKISNKDLVFKIAEEYANEGIELLTSDIEKAPAGAFDLIFQKEVLDFFDKISGSLQ